MIVEITVAFFLVALAAYTLFGGADFGGGALEATLVRHRDLRKKLQATLAPVWEAHHVWLIAVVVILFVGFPTVYTQICTALFVPLSIALLGIVLRGAFFTFRKYDPEPESRAPLYGWLFRLSSILTPVMFGFIVAALLTPLPRAETPGDRDFLDLFVRPWLTLDGALTGLFVTALFGATSAVFFHGELAEPRHLQTVRRRLALFFGIAFGTGGIILARIATQGRIELHPERLPFQIGIVGLATLLIPVAVRCLLRRHTWSLRLVAGLQVMAILAGWFSLRYPVFLELEDGTALTVTNSHAPEVTLLWLVISLAAGLTLVIPLLVWLYRVFAGREEA